jgi:hypothetical protein
VANYGADVNSWEIGNEMYHWVAADPDAREEATEALPDCYPEDGYSPEEQGQFIYDAGNYIKALDEDAVVTLASINSDSAHSATWLDEIMTTTDDLEFFDVLSIHAYDNWSRLFNTRDDLNARMAALGIEDKLVRLTEMGSSSDVDYINRTNYPNSDESQCSDIFRLPLVSWSGGVATAMWHTLAPLNATGGADFQGYELMEYDGTWKPSAYAYQLLTEELLPLVQVSEYQTSNRWIYKVHRQDGETRWVMWGERGASVPEGTTEYTSVYPASDGTYTWTPNPASGRMDLTVTPVIFR